MGNKFLMFSVKDVVANQFSDIKLFVNGDVAVRWYNSLLQESKISTDLQLWKVGEYDVETGAITPCLDYIKGGVVNE